jgi:hypothetical protein
MTKLFTKTPINLNIEREFEMEVEESEEEQNYDELDNDDEEFRIVRIVDHQIIESTTGNYLELKVVCSNNLEYSVDYNEIFDLLDGDNLIELYFGIDIPENIREFLYN